MDYVDEPTYIDLYMDLTLDFVDALDYMDLFVYFVYDLCRADAGANPNG